jgi:hypothetical protein
MGSKARKKEIKKERKNKKIKKPQSGVCIWFTCNVDHNTLIAPLSVENRTPM